MSTAQLAAVSYLSRYAGRTQTLTVHHGALAYLLGINALRAS